MLDVGALPSSAEGDAGDCFHVLLLSQNIYVSGVLLVHGKPGI